MSIDFYPTIMQLTGIEVTHQIDGVSLVRLLSGGDSLERRSLYWHYPHYSNQGGFPGGAVRRGNWKLLERFEDGRVHLYDLAADVGEQDDVAESNPERVAQLRTELHAWYDMVDAKFLQQKPGGPAPWRPAE